MYDVAYAEVEVIVKALDEQPCLSTAKDSRASCRLLRQDNGRS
jgi:hypothetical protein